MHERVEFTGAAARVLDRLRTHCLSYPESVEVEQFGHPWFKAGKRPFVIFGQQEGDPQIAFAADKMDQEALCAMDARFFPTPYMHQHGWVSLRLKGAPSKSDWGLIDDLAETAYRRVALKRMVTALDERAG